MAKAKRKFKSAKQDYTVAMLPHNRREVFFDVLKMNWGRFILYGFMFLLLSLPFHLSSVMQTVQIGNIMSNAELDETQKIVESMRVQNEEALIKIPCFVLLSFGIAGFSRVIRQYAWGENVFFGSDFFKGLKSNGFQMLLTGLLSGIVYAFAIYGKNYASSALAGLDGEGSNFLMSVFMNLPLVLGILVGIPLAAFSTVIISIYSYKYRYVLVTALMLMLKKPFKTLIALICCVGPFAIQLIPNLYVTLIARIILTMLVPYIYLAWQLFVLNKLDFEVNPEHYPELIGRGTYPDIDKSESAATEMEDNK